MNAPTAVLPHPAQRARPLAALLASICLAVTGNGVITTVVSLRLGRFAAGPSSLSFVLTAFPVGFLTGCLAASALVARFGHRATFCLAVATAALAGFAYACTDNLAVWSLLRLVNGVTIATVFVVCESWMNLYASPQNRGFLFSLYMLMTSVAVFFGQLLVAAGPDSPYLFPVAAVVVVVGLLLCLFSGPWPALPARKAESGEVPVSAAEQRRALFRLAVATPVTLAAVFLAGMTNVNVYALMPIYSMHVGLTASQSVALVTAFSIGGFVAQTPIGWLSDRVSRRAILLVQGVLAAGVCAAVVVLGNHAMTLLWSIFFIYGAIALTIYPIGIAAANAQLDRRHMVSAAGALLLLYSVGSVMTPSIAANLMAHVGPQALFVLLGSGAALLALVAGLDLICRPRSAITMPSRDLLAGTLDR